MTVMLTAGPHDCDGSDATDSGKDAQLSAVVRRQ